MEPTPHFFPFPLHCSPLSVLRSLFISPLFSSYHGAGNARRGRAQGVVNVQTDIEERVRDLAVYLLENRTTVRAAARRFGISKSTVHKDLTERLPRLSPGLFAQVRQLLEWNKAQRHIRGGLATRRKYKGE